MCKISYDGRVKQIRRSKVVANFWIEPFLHMWVVCACSKSSNCRDPCSFGNVRAIRGPSLQKDGDAVCLCLATKLLHFSTSASWAKNSELNCELTTRSFCRCRDRSSLCDAWHSVPEMVLFRLACFVFANRVSVFWTARQLWRQADLLKSRRQCTQLKPGRW